MGEEIRCDYCGKTGFKTPQALAGHIRFKHPETVEAGEAGGIVTPKTETREVPIVEDDFTTAELVRGKGMDIEKAPSYGVLDKLALRWLKAARTLLRFCRCLYFLLFVSELVIIMSPVALWG